MPGQHRLYRPRGPLAPPWPLFAPWLLAPALLPPVLRELRLLLVRSEAELRLLALRLVPLAFVPNWPAISLSVLLALARSPSLRITDLLPAELLRIPLAWVLARRLPNLFLLVLLRSVVLTLVLDPVTFEPLLLVLARVDFTPVDGRAADLTGGLAMFGSAAANGEGAAAC